MSTSILITGGAGFLGSHVIDAFLLEHERWSITVLDKRTPQNPREGVAYIQTDLLRQDDINSLMTEIRPKAVVHCASLVPPLDKRFVREMERELLAINVDATRILLRCCEEQGVAAFVFTGSCSAVMDDLRHDYRNVDETHPLSFSSLTYGESKALAEQMVLNANCSSLRTCVLRPSVLVGPGDYQLIPAIHACIAKGETCFVLGDGENLWDVSYAPNVAEAHVLAVENLLSTQTAAGEAFFIQNNEPIAFRDLCLEVWKNFGHYPPFEIKIPYAIAPLFGSIMDWITWALGKRCTISKGTIVEACATRYASGEKARKLLGYKARVGIEEGLRISCDHYKTFLKKTYGEWNVADTVVVRTEPVCYRGLSKTALALCPAPRVPVVEIGERSMGM